MKKGGGAEGQRGTPHTTTDDGEIRNTVRTTAESVSHAMVTPIRFEQFLREVLTKKLKKSEEQKRQN